MQVTENKTVDIIELDVRGLDRRIGELGSLMQNCVTAGASIGFILPFERLQAEAFWSVTIAPELKNNSLLLLVALVEGKLVGTGLLAHSMPANQPHRAETAARSAHPMVRQRQNSTRRQRRHAELSAYESARLFDGESSPKSRAKSRGTCGGLSAKGPG